MITSGIRAALASACLAGTACLAAPAASQSEMTQAEEDAAFAEIDALSDASANEQTGIQMAREQAERGEFLEALATLERVLASNPKSAEAKLIHAVYLCKIDDKQGGLVEIDKLKEKEFGSGTLDEARALCGREGA